MAATIPCTAEAFDSHWAKALDDPGNIVRAILFNEAFVGYISRFIMDGEDHVGESPAERCNCCFKKSPSDRVIATAATSNGASLRVLREVRIRGRTSSPRTRH